MVGRDAELSLLLEAFSRAEAGEAQVAVVTGEAGIGKTRLVRELVGRLPDETLVAFGHAVALTGGELPYGAAADLLRALVRQVGLETVREVLGERTRALAPLVPRLGEGAHEPVDRRGLFASTQDLLAELSAERVLVLVAEDAHWADESSLELMTFLTRTLVRGRLLFLLTTRTTSAGGQAAESVIGLLRLPNATAVDPRPLGRREIEEQVRAIDDGAGRDLLADVVRLSEGIPLYVEELLSGGTASPSASLRLDLANRLKNVSEPSARLLRLAALESRPVRPELLAVVAEHGLDEVVALLDEGFEAGLMEPVGSEWRFCHELLRLSTVASLRVAGRTEGHRRWADALTAKPDGRADDLVAAADHADQALTPSEALAARVAAARACEAVAHGALSAAQWQSVLSRVWRGDGELSEEEHEDALLGAIAGMSGWRLGLDVAQSEARCSSNPGAMRELFVKLCLLNGAWSLNESPAVEVSTEELVAMMDRVAAEPPRPFTLRILRLLGHTFRYLDDPDRADRAVDLAMDVASRLSSPPQGATGWMFMERLGNLETRTTDIEAFDEVVQQALVAIPADDFESRALMHARAAGLQLQRGRLLDGLEEAALAAELARAPELSGFAWHIAVGTGQELQWYAGRWADALRQSELLAVPGFVESVNCAVLVPFMVATFRGEPCRPDLAAAALEVPHLSSHDGSTGYATRHFATAMEALSAERVDPVRAREALRPCLEDGDLHLHHHLPDILTLAARLTGADSVPAEYRSSVEEAVTRALDDTPFEATFSRMIAAELDTTVGRGDGPTWPELADTCERMPIPWHAAWARLRLGTVLLRDGDREGACEALARALMLADPLGARPLADEIRTLASRARLRLPGHEPARAGPGPLTAREHEVLQLVVQGMTNDQIGTALFMSPRTASVHVSRILAKLGATNRTEVAAVAHRRGLVTGEG
jgi:DNA-binding CsgD family transcriptional regulator